MILIPGSLCAGGVERHAEGCRKLVFAGEVKGGEEWHAAVGAGWFFRLVPIAPGNKSYSGWDLVLDSQRGAGYPDALLLGTPPYDSLNEREVGTTFGLRAQDAIAWGPRRFRFLTTETDLARGRELFSLVSAKPRGFSPTESAAQASATTELLGMISDTSRTGTGQFTVLDAKLVLGLSDPEPFARQWASRLRQVPHTVVSESGSSADLQSARGALRWIRFRVTLWVPHHWEIAGTLPGGSTIEAAKCPQ